MKKDTLCIDIDDTLIKGEKSAQELRPTFLGSAMFHLFRESAVRKGMDKAEAEAIIEAVNQVKWWHWTDFIRALDLNPHTFWEYVYQEDSKYLLPVCDNLRQVFEMLLAAGYRMYIASNNPCSGMLHKLRIAGLADMAGSKYFQRYFSPCDLHYMKWDSEYWKRMIAHTGLDPNRIITIGDLWRDDIECPLTAGIKSRIHLDWYRIGQPEYQDGVWKTSNWEQILSILLAHAKSGVFDRSLRKSSVTVQMNSIQDEYRIAL